VAVWILLDGCSWVRPRMQHRLREMVHGSLNANFSL
jgi:hypothetical protein